MNRKAKLSMAGATVLLLLQTPGFSDEEAAETGLQLPDDLTLDNSGDKQYQEFRVGGRLERVTVTRESGFNETYRNHRADSLWHAEENELGEVPNMRQWTIGSW